VSNLDHPGDELLVTSVGAIEHTDGDIPPYLISKR
jgi:hypothetical protein